MSVPDDKVMKINELIRLKGPEKYPACSKDSASARYFYHLSLSPPQSPLLPPLEEAAWQLSLTVSRNFIHNSAQSGLRCPCGYACTHTHTHSRTATVGGVGS